MPVIINLSTTLRLCVPDYTPSTGISLDLEAPVSAGILAEKIGLPLDAIKIVMINGRHASLDSLVHDGDRLGYFPAVGGG